MKHLFKVDLRMVVASLLLIASSALGVIIPLAIRQLIDHTMSYTWESGVLLVVLFVGQALLVAMGNFLFAMSGEKKVQALREQVTDHLYHATMAFYDHAESGNLASRVINDTNSVRDFITIHVSSLITGLVTLLGSFVALIVLDWRLSLVLVVTLPLEGLIVIPISNLSERFSRQLQDATGFGTAYLSSSFRESEMIKANVAEAQSMSVASGRLQRMRDAAVRSDFVEAVTQPFVLLCLFGSVAVIFTYGGQRVANGSLSVGTLMSFLIYLFQLLNPIGAISDFFASRAKMKGATAKLGELYASPIETEQGIAHVPKADLTMNHVSFS